MLTIRFAPEAHALPYRQDVEAGIEQALASHPDTQALVSSARLSARSTGFEVRVRQGDRIAKAQIAFPRDPLDAFPTLEDTWRRVRATEQTVRRLLRSTTEA